MTREEITNSQDYKATKIALDWWRNNVCCPDIYGNDKSQDLSLEDAYADGVIYGWNNPQWIPVEEELPKHDVEENGLITYQEVLVSLYDGYVDTDTYDTQLKAWWQYEGEVEYWMPKPQPPRKEE